MAMVTASSHQYSIGQCSEGCDCKISAFDKSGNWNAWVCDGCEETYGRGYT